MSDKYLRLQRNTNEIIHELGESINRIKSAYIEPDIDTACGLFATELATVIAKCALMLGADIQTGVSF